MHNQGEQATPTQLPTPQPCHLPTKQPKPATSQRTNKKRGNSTQRQPGFLYPQLNPNTPFFARNPLNSDPNFPSKLHKDRYEYKDAFGLQDIEAVDLPDSDTDLMITNQATKKSTVFSCKKYYTKCLWLKAIKDAKERLASADEPLPEVKVAFRVIDQATVEVSLIRLLDSIEGSEKLPKNLGRKLLLQDSAELFVNGVTRPVSLFLFDDVFVICEKQHKKKPYHLRTFMELGRLRQAAAGAANQLDLFGTPLSSLHIFLPFFPFVVVCSQADSEERIGQCCVHFFF